MGEARRRRDAMKDDPTPELKQQIADVVRSVMYTTPVVGGMCLFRALCGQAALSTLGYEAHLMFGGCMFAAAPGDINILSMGGPGGIGMIHNGMLYGHVWSILPTTAGMDLVDFSAGDWHEQSDACTEAYSADLPLIDWQVEPPQFVWDRVDKLYVPTPLYEFDELTLGKPSYRGFRADQADILKTMQAVWVRDLMAVTAPLFNSIRHFAKELL